MLIYKIKSFIIAFTCALALITETACASLLTAVIQVPTNYSDIQDAVNNASPGDTILIDKGEYSGNIIINKAVAIRSKNGSEATVINALNPANPVFKISNAIGAEISGFTITGSIVSGIYLHESHNIHISGNKIIKNGSGIILYSSNDNALKNNIVRYNEQYGIYLESSNGNTLEKNSADSNNDKGIFLSLSGNNTLTDNSANLNTWNGVILWASNNNILKGNSILRNTYGLVISDSEENILNGNYIWSNIYIILPAILVYTGIVLFFIQKRIFLFIYSEK